MIAASQQKRFKKKVEGKAFNAPSEGFGVQPQRVVKVDDLEITSNHSNFDHNVDYMHDILKAYYKVARKRFSDNICMQATDDCLVGGPKGPLAVFGPVFVSTLSDVELESIAGEGPAQKKRRLELKLEQETLEQGRKILH